MSRRQGRDSESRRHRSRFDEEPPSPKRSRRDGKPETERPPANSHLDNRDHSDRDQKHRRRLQDALPLEASSEQDSKVGGAALSKEKSDKASLDHEGTKVSLDPKDIPRSRSYFQHDDRGNAGQVSRSFGRRAATERGWWRDSKEQQSERGNRISTGDVQKKDDRAPRVHGEVNDAWRHDKYFQVEADPKQPAKKRSFREQKDQDDSGKAGKEVEELLKPNPEENPVSESARRDERGGYTSRHSDRPEQGFAGDREANKGDAWRSHFSSRDRYGNRPGNYRGRDRFTARQGYRATTRGRVEKWKHDLYDEANRSPSPKNEEDVVAKVEALLAS
ncbi:uncharacterized protein LOC113762941 [Coffea eugenioides]|uniref:uncharacterized protein LOC113762941 n=1 Tax=Coffea eugenioides TaxID=49369 RepID=UPI000F60CA7F|nr:uncharacterized protein LOC113762941 [Coffea eugenioides]